MQPFVGLVPWPVFSSFLPSATCTATPFAPCSALAILHVSLSLIFDNVSRVLLLPNPPPSHFLLENNKKSHPKVIYLPVLFSFFSLFFWQEKSKSPNKESTVFAVEAFLIWRIKSAWMRTCCSPQSSIIIIVLFKRKKKKIHLVGVLYSTAITIVKAMFSSKLFCWLQSSIFFFSLFHKYEKRENFSIFNHRPQKK